MRPLTNVVHFIVALVQQAIRDKLSVRAAMLSYWTTVAVVPILLLAFALTGAAGFADSALRNLFYNTFLASSVEAVGAQLDQFLSRTTLNTLGVVGVISILLIGAQLYFQVEQAFNDIFYCKPKQSLINRFFGFYASITLGPLLIAGGFVVTNQVSAEVPSFLNSLASYLLPSLITAVGLVGLIRFLPSTEVSWRAAFWGGLTSAFLFEAAKRGFGIYTNLFGTEDSMTLLYGSLGLLPVFLIWLNILWTIVLLGVEVAYVRQHWEQLVEQQQRWVMDPHAESRAPDAFFALAVTAVVCNRFLSGWGATSVGKIADTLGADTRLVLQALAVLQEAGLLLPTEDARYLPGVPLETTPTHAVLDAWREVTAPKVNPEYPGADIVQATLAVLQDQLDRPLSETMRLAPFPAPRPQVAG